MAESTICGVVNLTVACNQDCVFCCDGELKGSGYNLTSEAAMENIRQVASKGAKSVTLIGGEPLIRKDIVDLVKFAAGLGLRVGISTNGTLLTESLLERLLAAGLTSIEVSVHTFDSELADRISRRKGTANKQRRALELLKRHASAAGHGSQRALSLGVSINSVVFALNYSSLPDFVATVAREYRFIDELFVNFVDPIGYSALNPSLVPRYSEIKENLLRALDLASAEGIPFTVDSVPGCILERYFLFLRAVRERAKGVLYAKETHGIVNPQPDEDLSQYSRVNACFDCPAALLCPGVNFRYLGIHGQMEFRPLPDSVFDEVNSLVIAACAERARGTRRKSGMAYPESLPRLSLRQRGEALREVGRNGLQLRSEEEEQGADAGRALIGRLVPAELAAKFPSGLPRARKITEIAAQAEQIVLTRECNNRCEHCPWRREGAPPFSPLDLATRLESLASSSRPVLLTGGEPPLHPNFFRILSLLSRNGRKVGFTTNGRVFSYPEWAQRAARAGASWVVVRLPAAKGRIDAITRVPGAEAQTLAGIENLLATRAFFVMVEERSNRLQSIL